jgi:hypothetical protein
MALPHARERVPTRQDLGGGSWIGTLDARRNYYGEDRRGRADHTPIADTLSKKPNPVVYTRESQMSVKT